MKVLASDYDGTLRVALRVSEDDKKAIQIFRDKGHHFGIVTGRSIESLKTEIAENGLEFDFIITNNGGVIYNKELELLQCIYMDFNSALDIITYIKTLDCVSYVINDGYHRYKFVIDENQIDHKYGNVKASSDQQETVLDRGKIAQLVISLNDAMLAEEIAQYINYTFKGYAVAYVNVNCVDIVPDGVSKAEGLYFIEGKMGYDHDNIYAIGDSFNDIPMLEEFHGCSVAHARSEIKEKAVHVYEGVSACIMDIMEKDM